VRFGRSTRTLAAVGRRLLGERADGEQDGVASEERSALLNSPTEDPDMEYTPREQPALGADPTQRLLTALGRFQRQVNKAESGVPQHLWTDECMEQLIEGISIAHENDWHDVKEALTDTARILQSYEEAGVAPSAVAFLQDSYEILCLMVGDIIVDNVRSGVMNKWRQRYDHALNDLARQGVSLIDDDTGVAEDPPANIVRFAQPSTAAASTERSMPFADPDLGEEDEYEAETETEQEQPEQSSADAFFDGGSLGVDETVQEEDVFTREASFLDDDDSSELSPLEEVGAVSELAAPAIIEELEEEALLEDDTVESVLDLDAEPAPEVVAEIEALEDEDELPALDEVIYEEPEAPANVVRLEELDRQSTPTAERAADFLFDAPAQTPRVSDAAEVAAAAVRDPDEDVQSLLRTAQQAMSRGDVANAKVMTLQIAVKMAELEVSRAKDSLRVAEERLEDTARAIEAASESVRRTDAGVSDVEEQIAQREMEFQQKRDQVGGLREQIATGHTEIADIDEQIRQLQLRRDEAERHVEALQGQLEEGLATESRIQTDLDMLAQEEEAAREATDAAKQRVRDLQRERLARESDINDSRNALKLQERSVDDIQHALQQVTAGPEPTEEHGLLF